jgi:5S rRNA maturation endonuclease (ribonuclease M5)
MSYYDEVLEEIEEALTELMHENEHVPVIVEGEKDEEALRKLGLTGRIIRLNTGVSLSDFCDKVSASYKTVILLIDWDRKGGRLFSMLKKHFRGRVKCNTTYRDVFAKRCMIRTVEGLPSWILTLKKRRLK